MTATQADLAIVRDALRAHPRTEALADVGLQPLVGGLGNRSWRADADGESYVVRLNGADDAALGIDRESEAALIAVAHEARVAPEPVVSDPLRRLLVMRYVPGAAWTLDQARRAQNLGRLAGLLTRLHACTPLAGIKPRSFRHQARRLEATGRDRGLAADADLERRSQPVFERLETVRAPATPCHNDVHHLNVIDDGGSLTLIDWEYGGLGNPCYDLAATIACHELDAPQRGALLAAYHGPANLRQVDDALWAFDYVQWLWYRAAAQNGAPPERATLEARAEDLRRHL
jgi:thiamine kinase-like enzyme